MGEEKRSRSRWHGWALLLTTRLIGCDALPQPPNTSLLWWNWMHNISGEENVLFFLPYKLMHLLVHYNLRNYVLQQGCGQAAAVKVVENEQVSSVCLCLATVNASPLQFLRSRQQRDGADPHLAWSDWAEIEPSRGTLRLMFTFVLFSVCLLRVLKGEEEQSHSIWIPFYLNMELTRCMDE